MQTRSIIIEEKQITEETPIARQIIQSSSLFETFQTIDRGTYGTTVVNLDILDVLERALSVLIEMTKQLQNIITADRGKGFDIYNEMSVEDIVFTNMFSLYAASVEALERLEAMTDKVVKVGGTFKLKEVTDLIRLDTGSIPRKLIKDCRDYIQFYRDHSNPARRVNSSDKLLNCITAYFKLMRNSLSAISGDAAYAKYRKAIEDININVLGKSFEGFTYSVGEFGDNSHLMQVKTSDIIGNEGYVNGAIKLAKDIAGFDLEAWENPKRINPILFAMGSPGCGKTVTAHAVGNFFLDFCKERGIPSRFVIIRRTDWASSYQNASAKQLIDIFKRNVLGYKGVVGIYWPDIDTAFAARGDSGLRNEEKNVLGAVFGLFDGTILPKNGQWFMLCDANYLNMDKATISRITQDPYYVKGPVTPEDFVHLFRDVKMSGHKEFLKFTDEEWQEFGEKCIEYKLSGRSIDNISRKVVSTIEDFEFPEEYYKANIEEKRKIIKEYSNSVDYKKVDEILKHYRQFEKESEEKSARKKFQDRVDEITNYLSAKKHVLDTFVKSGELEAGIFEET
ncbi:MAG: ATP-binding protein [Candidatus Eremiobacteraeota bacterium]|nr:ATP-binding protein [Candidatus Eremiobacteraeota bacterium]